MSSTSEEQAGEDGYALFAAAYSSISAGRPEEGVAHAREAALLVPNPADAALALGGIFVDAGAALRDRALVREGIHVMETALPTAPEEAQAHFHYNLGTGHSTLASRERGRGALTKPSLRPAIEHLALAVEARPSSPEFRVNLANALKHQGRSIEALDILHDVIAAHPEHHQALASRADALVHVNAWIRPHQGLLEAARADAERALALALQDEQAADVIRYEALVLWLTQRAKHARPAAQVGEPSHMWIWEARLALNVCPFCELETPDAFDLFALHGLLKAPRRRPSSQELVEIVNSWHRTFSVARWNLLQASEIAHALPVDHVPTVTGIPQSAQGLRSGLLIDALVGFHSVLDQIGWGLNASLHLRHSPKAASFSRIWARKGWKRKAGEPAIPAGRAELHERVRRAGAPGLAALYGLAWSFEAGNGMYRDLRELRNKAEHHVLVPTAAPRESRYVHMLTPEELLKRTIQMGRVAKAAIWYGASALWWFESRRVRRLELSGESIASGDPAQVIRQ